MVELLRKPIGRRTDSDDSRSDGPSAGDGAHYFKADLQVHTPSDPGWPGAEPKDADKRREVALAYLDAAQQRGIELVGITEHHDVSWIDELRHAARRLGMYLLPGFEVETQEGIHVLSLFDADTSVLTLEDALAILGLDRAKRSNTKLTDIRSSLSLNDLVDTVQQRCGGICIAAHATSRKGVLTLEKGGARADFWKAPGLFAAQLPCEPSKLQHAGIRAIALNEDPSYRRDRPLAYVLTSDSRSEETIGTQSVWIKMHRPSVGGLRQAFLDPESRIAFEDPASEGAPRIARVSWDGGYLRDQAVALNPELTCLIGGKGTGKSAVIESIRWAFGLEPETDQGRAAVEGLRAFALPSGSKVSVEFDVGAPAPRRWSVERTAPHAPIVRDDLGQQQPDLTPSDLLTLRVYGQKEVYDVAQSTRARLGLVDTFAVEQLRAVAQRERDLLKHLRRNKDDLTRATSELDEAAARLGELPALLQWRERFRSAGFEKRLRERRLLERESQLLETADNALRERHRVISEVFGELPMAPDLSGGSEAANLPNRELIQVAEEEVASTFGRADDAVRQAQEELRAGRERLALTREQWHARRATRQADFDRALRELQVEAPDVNPEQYLDVERRIEALAPLRDTIPQLEERVTSARSERARLLVDLQDSRGDKHRRRVEAAERLTAATGGSVRVQIHYQQDRFAVLAELQSQKTKARADALTRMVEDPQFSPAAFAQKVRSRTLTSAYALPDGQAGLLERTLSEDVLLDLETTELCDGITVELDVGQPGEPDFRELDRLSPGQKSTAILLLILQSSRDPLLIDQPEDDLDNRFIYHDVVQRIRSAKRLRQVIVATHNANIPVLGDAEQIVVLDARAEPRPQGHVLAHGTVDDALVREAAEEILEGGEEAFRRRREKYGW